MSSIPSPLDLPFQRLRQFRTALLHLHKALLESERVTYEKQHGRIQSKGEFFRLVVGDEWFSWLRPYSKFIVKIDETLDSKEPVTLDEVNRLLEEASFLLRADETGSDREKRYYQAIQRDPNIALMHAQAAQLLD
ncbi:MAG: hypothetical protein ACP5D7_10220 [Limnospira sp.]